MAEAPWISEVARLLEEAAEALRGRRYRRVIVTLGTAVGYVQRARDQGDRFAHELLKHTIENSEASTERFTFQPGELEALTAPNEKK